MKAAFPIRSESFIVFRIIQTNSEPAENGTLQTDKVLDFDTITTVDERSVECTAFGDTFTSPYIVVMP